MRYLLKAKEDCSAGDIYRRLWKTRLRKAKASDSSRKLGVVLQDCKDGDWVEVQSFEGCSVEYALKDNATKDGESYVQG